MPKYKLNLPQGANTRTITSYGTQPNQRFWKNLHKNKNPNSFLKNPQILETKLKFLHKLKET